MECHPSTNQSKNTLTAGVKEDLSCEASEGKSLMQTKAVRVVYCVAYSIFQHYQPSC